VIRRGNEIHGDVLFSGVEGYAVVVSGAFRGGQEETKLLAASLPV